MTSSTFKFENVDLQNIKNINIEKVSVDTLYKYCIITVSFLSIILLVWGIF